MAGTRQRLPLSSLRNAGFWVIVSALAFIVEKLVFAEGSLTKVAGARGTARFDVHVVYERKVDVASECERLKKELERLEKGIGSGQRCRFSRTVAAARGTMA